MGRVNSSEKAKSIVFCKQNTSTQPYQVNVIFQIIIRTVYKSCNLMNCGNEKSQNIYFDTRILLFICLYYIWLWWPSYFIIHILIMLTALLFWLWAKWDVSWCELQHTVCFFSLCFSHRKVDMCFSVGQWLSIIFSDGVYALWSYDRFGNLIIQLSWWHTMNEIVLWQNGRKSSDCTAR